MDHARDRRTSPVFNVGRRPCDGARRRDASKEGGTDISQSLCNEFHVRVMFAADHAVRHHTREQGFDRGQNCNSKCIRQNGFHGFICNLGKVEGRKGRGNRIEIPNRIDLKSQCLHKHRRYKHRYQRRRHFFIQLWPHNQYGKGDQANSKSLQICSADAGNHLLQFFHGLKRRLFKGQPQKIFNLPYNDRHRNPRREPGRDRKGDKPNHAAQPEKPHGNQKNTGNHGCDNQTVHPIAGHDSGYDRCKCGRRSGNLYLAAAEK